MNSLGRRLLHPKNSIFGIVFLTSLGLAYWARYNLIENPALSALCEPAPWQSACALRSAVIECFIEHRIAWVALGVSLMAMWAQTCSAALLANGLASAGLVLYCTDLASVALLLSGIAFLNASNANSKPPTKTKLAVTNPKA